MSKNNVEPINKNQSDDIIEKEQERVDNSTPLLTVAGVSGERLTTFIQRVERLEEEKAALLDDIKEIYAEAKSVGFDTKIMRKVVRLRKMDTEKRREEEELLDIYKSAIGMTD